MSVNSEPLGVPSLRAVTLVKTTRSVLPDSNDTQTEPRWGGGPLRPLEDDLQSWAGAGPLEPSMLLWAEFATNKKQTKVQQKTWDLIADLE
jgi:hypothetical protein